MSRIRQTICLTIAPETLAYIDKKVNKDKGVYRGDIVDGLVADRRVEEKAKKSQKQAEA